MNLETLSLQEREDLSLAASMECFRRLQELARWADPEDEPVQRILRSLALNQDRRIEKLEQSGARLKSPRPPRHRPEDLRRLIREHFPSLTRPLGEGIVGREEAMHLAGCLEEESALFDRLMANLSSPDRPKAPLLDLERLGDSFLGLLRSVLMAGTDRP